MLTLDVRNVFNSAPRQSIIEIIIKTNASGYLVNILKSYLFNRTIVYEVGSETKSINIMCGVPQGSFLRPELWNLLYDSLLQSKIQCTRGQYGL